MYKKIISNVFFCMMPPYYADLMHMQVVELKTAHLLVEDHFKIH